MTDFTHIEHRREHVGYGLIRHLHPDGEQLEYIAAVEVTQASDPPSGMEYLELEGSKMAKFCHKGAVSGLDHTVNYIYSSWLLNSEETHSYGTDIEIYGPEYHPTSSNSSIHYAIPIW